MIKKAKETFKNINKISMYIMRHGLQLACGTAVIAAIYFMNANTLVENQIARAIMQIAVSLFAETLIFGFIIDSYAQRSK